MEFWIDQYKCKYIMGSPETLILNSKKCNYQKRVYFLTKNYKDSC